MISICIATYNGEKYIAEQLGSILPQLSAEDEVIVSDDGSTDHTIEIIKAFSDSRITIIEGPKLHSPTRNFENAMRHSKGEFIFLSDQDDVWKENKVSIMMEYLKQYACVVSDCHITDKDLNVTADSFRKAMGFKTGKWYNLLVQNSYSGSCMAFRREVATTAVPMPENILMHDIWLGNVAAFKYSLTFIPDCLMYFRRHGSSASTAGNKSNNSLIVKLRSRLTTALSLLSLKRKKDFSS